MRSLNTRVLRKLAAWMVLAFGTCAEAAASGGDAPAIAPDIKAPLIAHWTFDEISGDQCEDASGHGWQASLSSPAASLARRRGLYGGAVSLSGSHLLRVSERIPLADPAGISFSVWAKPTELSVYREIFRKEDGNDRVLFSFQHDGTILSLGLNIGGYVECDAGMTPEQVRDGRWHHCAATYDGRWMRVYLDGREIGNLERPGVVRAGGSAPGCIGSSNGGECFQGGLDELRIFGGALSAEEVAALHDSGRQALAAAARHVPAGEPVLGDMPPALHWAFNEQADTDIVCEAGGLQGMDARGMGGVQRVAGLYGSSLQLETEHQVRLEHLLPLRDAKQVTFSVWVRPTALDGFREIFRQESDHRLLFSFQADGSILSLGLDTGGYAECDASIDRKAVADGRWHHVAGTFDGQTMRVYLDGSEIGAMPRGGPLRIDPGVVAFIGSSSGGGEFFQGNLDDLRLYTIALTPDQVAELTRHGQAVLIERLAQVEKTVGQLYCERDTFPQTLADTRALVGKQVPALEIDVLGGIASRMQSRFPAESEQFVRFADTTLLECLAAKQQHHRQLAERLVELMVEYRPVTEEQWRRQSPEQRAAWDEATRIEKRLLALQDREPEGDVSPEWIEVVLEAGGRVQFRPRVQEAVAPYARPATPPTVDLMSEEALATQQRDWLFQADGNPTLERVRQEVEWARQLAARIARRRPGGLGYAAELAQLDALEKQLPAEGVAQDLYFAVRQVKRTIMLKNPVVDFSRVLFVDMPYPAGSEWPHETRHRLGYMAVPGGRLLILDGLSPAGRLTQLMPQPPLHGSFWRPDVSFDARTVVFCFKPHNEKAFHLYEINVDGSGLRQLTDGIYDDLDPVYLPDGHILFSTTRGHTYVRCMPPTNAFVLARCDRDGKDVYLISANNEPDYLPSVMNDGRVIYTRWEYTDKPLWRAQKLWTINPDGTQVLHYWGNQSVWPDLMKDARSIPGSQRVMFTGSAHHDWFSGSVGLIDPDAGYNFPHGITKITADVPWPEVGNGPVDPVECSDYHRSGDYTAYYSPYPLSEQDFLVSARRSGKFLLYLMDVYGNRELIYEGVHNIFHAVPLKPRPRPPLIIDRVAWPDRHQRQTPQDGVLFSGNVYQGTPPELQDKARHLRVLHIDPKTYTYWHKRPYISTGPVVSTVQSEGVKRVLGTVPIEADGSVAFRAPPGMALHFQLLDEQYRALQTMRSFVGLMPGEQRGCLGCHEGHSRTPRVDRPSLALTKEPRTITPPPWGEDTVSYPRYVQPVLEQYCGECHLGDGEAVKVFDLTPRPGFLDFAEPYHVMTGRPTWGQPYEEPESPPPGWGIAGMLMVEGYSTTDPAAYRAPPPMTALSYRSRLVDLCSSGEHYDVKVDPVSLQRLIAWVDAMCPYNGDEEVRMIDDPVFQGVDWLSIRPRIKSAPTIVRPGPVD